MEIKANVIQFEVFKKGIPTIVEASVFDGKVLFRFQDAELCKEAYDCEQKAGRVRVKLYLKQNIYVEFYTKKSQALLTEYIRRKLLQAGAKEKLG